MGERWAGRRQSAGNTPDALVPSRACLTRKTRMPARLDFQPSSPLQVVGTRTHTPSLPPPLVAASLPLQVVGRAEPHNLKIAHPVQDRVLTMRENARAQVRQRAAAAPPLGMLCYRRFTLSRERGSGVGADRSARSLGLIGGSQACARNAAGTRQPLPGHASLCWPPLRLRVCFPTTRVPYPPDTPSSQASSPDM